MERQSKKTTSTASVTVASLRRKAGVGIFCVAALLMGCSEQPEDGFEGTELIGFQAMTTGMGSRAAVGTTSDNLKERPFEVYAFADDGSPFIGHTLSGETQSASEGVEIRHDGTGWDYADPADRAYWPKGGLDFFAFHPKQAALSGYSLEVSSPQKQVLRYALPFTPELQTDVLYAIHRRVTRDLHAGKAPLHFRHALTQVGLQVRTERPNMEVDIEDLKIHNLSYVGTLTLPTDAEIISQTDWNLGDKVTLDFEPKRLPEAVTHIGIEPVRVSQQLYLPQVLTAWNPQKQTLQAANAARQSYLSVSCRIRQRGVYLWGDKNRYERLFIPFAANWEPGKRYVYTLTLGGGYDEKGQKVVAPIGFEVNEAAWESQGTTLPVVSLTPAC